METGVKSGMVAIVGPPNAGKSTLLNRFLGQKISIVSSKPQTTRNRISGIVNSDDYQIVLLDTPGLHKARDPLNLEMMKIALGTLAEVDLILFLVDVSLPVPEKRIEDFQSELQSYLKESTSPVILILNKIDLIDRGLLLPLIECYKNFFPFQEIIPISALRDSGITTLLKSIVSLLPEGPRLFPEDIPTDVTERFLCGEIIREKIFLMTGQEIPYSTAVLVESFKEDMDRGVVTIHAAIVVDRDSQKGIIIGKGGKKLKSIGIAARKDIEILLDSKVVLKLWVKVHRNWAEDKTFLRELAQQ